MNFYTRLCTQFLQNKWKYFSFRIQETKNLLLSVLGMQPNWQPALIWQENTEVQRSNIQSPNEILDSLKGDGFLWGVPKKRRSLERRLTRRLAPSKLYKLKRNLLVCDVCGHYHQAHTICGNCYEKVKRETEVIQKAIENELKWEPVEKEVLVVYKDEKIDQDIAKDKRIVEIPEAPPQWFCRNLLIKTQIPEPATTSIVQSSDKTE